MDHAGAPILRTRSPAPAEIEKELVMQLDYTVETAKPFDEAVEAVLERAAAGNFTVQFVHDVAATLAEKGFPRDRVTIVEMCNARYASAVLARDVKIGLMLPCPVMIYIENGRTFISTMKPSLIGRFFPEADLGEVAAEVESIICRIIDEAAA